MLIRHLEPLGTSLNIVSLKPVLRSIFNSQSYSAISNGVQLFIENWKFALLCWISVSYSRSSFCDRGIIAIIWGLSLRWHVLVNVQHLMPHRSIHFKINNVSFATKMQLMWFGLSMLSAQRDFEANWNEQNR